MTKKQDEERKKRLLTSVAVAQLAISHIFYQNRKNVKMQTLKHSYLRVCFFVKTMKFIKILVVQQPQAVWRQSGCMLAESFAGI